MLAYVDREDLARAMAHVAQVTPRSGASPVLSHALIVVLLGRLRITGTDTEAAVVVTVPATAEEQGEATVEAAALLAALKACPEPTVRIGLPKSRRGRMEIASGHMVAQLPSMEAADYPALPPWDGEAPPVAVSGADLRAAIERMGHAVSTDDARWGLNGARLDAIGNAIRMVGTDGHRLAWSTFAVPGPVDTPQRSLVPRKALAVIRKSVGDGPVDLAISPTAIRIQAGARLLWFRLIDGEFPDYAAIMPKAEPEHVARYSVALLSAALRRLDLVSEGARATQMQIGDGTTRLRLEHVERGTVTDEAPGDLEGEPITLGINHRYMLDALAGIPGDDVEIRITHPLAPVVLSAPDDEGTVQVVMPMRLD